MKRLSLLFVLVWSIQANAQFWQGFLQGMNQATQQMQRQMQIEQQRQQQLERQRQLQAERERQAEAARVKKTLMSENDGYSWYKTEQYGKYGAETTGGKTIVPISFSSVSYYKGCFYVKNGEYEGTYEKDGTYVIPTSRGYTSVCKHDANDGYYYGVEKNGKKGACDASGREIIAPQYTTKILFYSGDVFKYEDANGNNISTGISLNGSASSGGSSLTNAENTIDFIYDLYIKKTANEDTSPIPSMPKNGDGSFLEYIVRFELNVNTIDYKIMTVDRMNNDQTKVLESYSITPSSSSLAIIPDGRIQFSEFEDGKPKGVLVNIKGNVAVGKWDNTQFVEGWNFVPFSLYDGLGGVFENAIAAYKGLIQGFNENKNFEHTQAGETDFNGKYNKLKVALQRYNWKRRASE